MFMFLGVLVYLSVSVHYYRKTNVRIFMVFLCGQGLNKGRSDFGKTLNHILDAENNLKKS